MRVTDKTLTSNFLLSVNTSRERIGKLQAQLASGKRVANPSDDPQAASRILRLKAAIAKNEQFQKNVGDGEAMMQQTEHALDSFADIMVQAKEILTKARSGSRTIDLGTFADQIDQLLSSAVEAANTQFNGKYLFGGTQTTSPPFILAPDRSTVTINPNGITGSIRIPVSDGTTQVINIDGQEAFLGTQIFQALIDVRDSMRAGNVPTAAQFDAINSHLNYVSQVGGKAGLILNSLDLNDRFLSERANQLAALLSADEDTDVAQATLQLQQEQLTLEAALHTGAQLLPKTLMDFLG